MKNNLVIRPVQISDAPRLVEIYAPYILEKAVSFEYKVPTVEEFTQRIKTITQKYPYLVCTEGDKIIGYVYADTYSSREAYNWTVTTSIYVDKDYRRNGAGTLLYEALEEKLKAQGIVNLLAGVAYCEKEDEHLSHDSSKFHLKKGYTEVAHMKGVGKKFDKWYDLIWYQKKI